ncbi:MAG: polyprenyl synthetase family protein [Planctomycetes bacterium]|nr:polyprenyl synthetase family protein [Planctomycetota bacterium]
MNRLHKYIDDKLPGINAALEKALPKADMKPEVLHEAMRASVIGGGKRLRPLLVIMSSRACGGGDESEELAAGCALEMIHSYSLIHDDLPCMDNADMRRGKLSCHKAYGEAMAVLAGDALLTMAFEVLASGLAPEKAARACAILAKASGSVGMVGGQVLDLEGEGKKLELDQIEAIDKWKTGALITAACKIGGIVAGAKLEDIDALSKYGRALGVMFQITDDLLDIESTSEVLGKTAGQDAKQGKATYPAILGIEEARELAKDKSIEAKEALKGFSKDALMLRLLSDYVLERKK